MRQRLLEILRFNPFWNFVSMIFVFWAVNMLASQIYVVFFSADYLSLHTILECITILVALSICTIVWMMWEGFDDYCGKFLLVFGLSFFAVGIVDFMHTLSYKGMPPFITPSGQDKAIFFWLYGRYLVAIGFIVAYLLPKENGFCIRKVIRVVSALTIIAIAVAALLGTKYLDLLPPLYHDYTGLTPLKIYLEYILIILFMIEGFLLWIIRSKLPESVMKNLSYFFLFSVFSELTLTFYSDFYDTYNFLGHIYKVCAYYFLFKAVYLSGVINHFYTLGEMGKMSAELLKDNISLETVLEIQMTKLKKLIPQAEQICVHLVTLGPSCYRTVYSWGKFSELFPVSGEFCLPIKPGTHMQLFTEPANILEHLEMETYTPSVSVILKASNQLLRVPLVSNGALLGVILLFIFNSTSRFTPDIMEKAKVFQQFATLAITQATNHETILKLSFEDSLTGLPNRRHFFEELSKVKYDADQYDLPFTVVYLDMNDLKFINDNLGHDAGDLALKEIGKALKKAARVSDVPARIGGDEFAILFRHMGLAGAEQIIAELKESFAKLPLGQYNHDFSLAVGGASYPEEANSVEQLLSLADDRMYEHKRQVKACKAAG